jgi:hypothetical protein
MKLISVMAAIALIGTGTALAQTKQPGGNVAQAQGPCSQGYEAAVKDGRMNISDSTMQAIDTDKDGRLSKVEFDNACAKKLLEQSETRN